MIEKVYIVVGVVNDVTSYLRHQDGDRRDKFTVSPGIGTREVFTATMFMDRSDAEEALDSISHGVAKCMNIVPVMVLDGEARKSLVALDLEDMDGQPLHFGDKVMVFRRKYRNVGAVLNIPGCKVIEVDTSCEEPIPDTPLISGTLAWCEERLQVVVKVASIHVGQDAAPATISVSRTEYAFKLLECESKSAENETPDHSHGK